MHLHIMHTETETHDICRCGAQRSELGEAWTVAYEDQVAWIFAERDESWTTKYQEQLALLFAGLGEE